MQEFDKIFQADIPNPNALTPEGLAVTVKGVDDHFEVEFCNVTQTKYRR